jgi:hypothetical protein
MMSKAVRGGGSEESENLPSLDSTGKVHGELPRSEDLDNHSPEDLRKLQDELRQSVGERIRTTEELGPDRGHGQRQGEEQQLIRKIDKHLENR